MKVFNFPKNYYDNGIALYSNCCVKIKHGLTVLVGCNGIGKSTLIRYIKDNNEKNKVPTIYFDNLFDGGENARSSALFYGDIPFLATAAFSSEGENIIMNMGNFASKVGKFVRENLSAKELWILMDAIDSGLSIDNVADLKRYLINTVLNDVKDKDLYIIVSANAYEMASGEQCFDVYNGTYITFNNYDEYRNMVLESRRYKEERENKYNKKG